jgi:hypothetical protein
MTGRQTRAEPAATPLARDSIRKIAESVGGCLRPVQLRRTDIQTGEMVPVMVPCGATLASICPPCAERAKILRAAQCREGWHLEDEPDLTPAAPDEMQEFWLTLRAEAQLRRDTAAMVGQDTSDYDELIRELDDEITAAGIRGTVTTRRSSGDGSQRGRRSRSTRRRQDAAPLPGRKIAPRTTGKVYTAPDGKRYRPSMFLTLTCDSYGKVNDDGSPADPDSYDYTRAARDAIHFAALFDRFIQNLRRVLGYEVQYFGGVEPQKRLAPHIHLAVRGSVPRPSARLGMVPGACKGKAHRAEHCGYAGRRVLVSRKWSGKMLADHRADRKAWLVETLGLELPDPARYTWSQVTPSDPDYPPPGRRLLHVVANRARWKSAPAEARRRAGSLTVEPSATGEAA